MIAPGHVLGFRGSRYCSAFQGIAVDTLELKSYCFACGTEGAQAEQHPSERCLSSPPRQTVVPWRVSGAKGLKVLLGAFECQLLNKAPMAHGKLCTRSLPQFFPLPHRKISCFCLLCVRYRGIRSALERGALPVPLRMSQVPRRFVASQAQLSYVRPPPLLLSKE